VGGVLGHAGRPVGRKATTVINRLTDPRPAGLRASPSWTLVYWLSAVVGLLMAAASLLGVLNPDGVYPSQALIQSFVPNDVVNLGLGVPLPAGALWLARRGRLIGLLCWLGAILYALYTYLIYLFALPFGAAFLLALTLVTLSAYVLLGLVAAIDGAAVGQRLRGAVPERVGGGVLAGLGTLFFLRAVGVAFNALASRTAPSAVEISTLAADFILTPAWVVGGIMLWRRAPLGYVAGLGLLFQASMLFVGLIAVLLLQPLLTAAP
jgi:hypothetical protein